MRIAFFPLVSANKFKSDLQEVNSSAVSKAPVKISASTWLCETKYFPTSSSRVDTNCRTSFGTPALHRFCAINHAVATVSGADLRITVFPAASAAQTPPSGIANGKFHGGTITTTPTGVEPCSFSREESA